MRVVRTGRRRSLGAHPFSLRLRRGRNRLLGMDAFGLGLGEAPGAKGTRGVGGPRADELVSRLMDDASGMSLRPASSCCFKDGGAPRCRNGCSLSMLYLSSVRLASIKGS